MRTVDLLGPLVQDLAEWRMARGRPGLRELVFEGSTPEGGWTDSDVRNWRCRVWRPALVACRLVKLTPAELDALPREQRDAACEATKDCPTKIDPYDLRHSFASLLIHEGRDIAYIAEQLGHSPARTLDTYTHVMRELQDQERVPAEEEIRRAREQVFGQKRAI